MVLLLLAPGAGLADQLPGVGGEVGAPGGGDPGLGEEELEEGDQARDELCRDPVLGGAAL